MSGRVSSRQHARRDAGRTRITVVLAAVFALLVVPTDVARAQDVHRSLFVAPLVVSFDNDGAARGMDADPAQSKPKPGDTQPKPTPPPARSRPASTRPSTPAFTIAGLVDVGFVSFASARPMEAVYDTANGLLWGGGVRVTHRTGLFGRVTAYHYSKKGERVFVFGGQAYPLGIATTLTVVPLDFTGGWRFLPRERAARPAPPKPPSTAPRGTTASAPQKPGSTPPPRTPSRTRPPSQRKFVPYVGGGVGIVSIKEEGDFASTGDDVSESHTSYHVLGGVEYPISKLFGAGVEAGWRWVPNGLAGSGVAQEFNETDLNHFFLMARFTIGR